MEVARNTEDPCKAPVPEGLQQHLNNMLRAVLLSRPVQLNRFFAEYFEAELDRRTLNDLQSSDVFIRIDEEISERQKRGKFPDRSSTKPSATPTMKQPKEKISLKEPKTIKTPKPEERKQMSGDDFDSEYYVNYFLTHETDDTAFDSAQSDAEYHEGHAFGADQLGVKRDSKYYIDYFLTHETIKRKPRTEKHAQYVFVPVQYDSDNFVDYFLTHETDPSTSNFDQSDRDYSKAYCLPFQDVNRRDSEYCRNYFLTCEATEEETFVSLKTEEKIFSVSDDNYVDYFLTHETDPRISSFDQSDRDYSKAYCLPFKDVSRRDSEYCRDYFLTCEGTEGENIVSDSTAALPLSSEPDKNENVLGKAGKQHEQEDNAVVSSLFTTFPPKESFGDLGERRGSEN